MALRDQPYLPLYVQDFLTDERLIECSAEATGVFIRIMCIMHKSEEYGKILLKQKDKQNTEQIKNFAWKLARQFPYPAEVVERSVAELVAEGVLQIDGDFLIQKRMVHDNHVSIQRSLAGKKGGSFAQAKVKANTQAKHEAKGQANSEYEYATTNEDTLSSKEHKAANSKKNETIDLVFPYTGEKFMQVWNELIRGPKWKRKTKSALQASLIQIGEYSEGNEATAIQIMMNSLAGNWQGVFPIDRKNQHTMTNGREKTDASIAAKFVSDTNEAIRIFRERHQG